MGRKIYSSIYILNYILEFLEYAARFVSPFKRILWANGLRAAKRGSLYRFFFFGKGRLLIQNVLNETYENEYLMFRDSERFACAFFLWSTVILNFCYACSSCIIT